jgi:hypothetical protein
LRLRVDAILEPNAMQARALEYRSSLGASAGQIITMTVVRGLWLRQKMAGIQMKSFMTQDDPVASVRFSPDFLRYFLCMPAQEAWALFGDVPYQVDRKLPLNAAQVIYRSGKTELVECKATRT